ncbi:hypothetical protein EJ066_03015 [Mesorhizobium sp. M9A.F.Ca.ET.002.03.1.2]|uniref:hypothetical protein n=1 Tax=Mesorhizobium sp. M9A.F.Ca.ET.002.03.1.2 TaxID=2493668 RepID=UPI000F757B15|nr:hypothetical protein [Mesorhizobium sp. M9A.F.Ca.ET.002.03.1.2]AZN96348.1 hypothetical protein EJ066_03015 [Mesorhizobium sp. M9A.F.Ca.ET.002.03.1.2]
MISAVSITLTVGMAAMPIIAGAAAILSVGKEVIPRTVSWSGQPLRAKEKDDSADEYKRQDANVQPSGRGHLSLARFPHLGNRSNSTARM